METIMDICLGGKEFAEYIEAETDPREEHDVEITTRKAIHILTIGKMVDGSGYGAKKIEIDPYSNKIDKIVRKPTKKTVYFVVHELKRTKKEQELINEARKLGLQELTFDEFKEMVYIGSWSPGKVTRLPTLEEWNLRCCLSVEPGETTDENEHSELKKECLEHAKYGWGIKSAEEMMRLELQTQFTEDEINEALCCYQVFCEECYLELTSNQRKVIRFFADLEGGDNQLDEFENKFNVDENGDIVERTIIEKIGKFLGDEI